MNIKLFIIDDHEVVRQGLKAIFKDESDMEVVGESDGCQGVLEDVIKTAPDIVLLDIRINGSDGFGIASQLHQQCPSIKILMISGYESELYLAESLKYKVHGFIPKGSRKDYVCTAIKMVALGGTVWGGDLLYRAIQGTSPDFEDTQQSHGFEGQPDSRELKLMVLLAKGKANKEIATELGVSIDTIKKIIHNLMQRYKVSNRTRLATVATELHLI
jgi:DNA-binding NarL/FixJ family response regulator